MANLIKCTACPFHLDATGMSPGSVLQCPNCGASVKIPTGQTGKMPAAKPAIPVAQPVQPAAKAPTGVRRAATGTTPVFKKAAGSKSMGRRSAEDRPVQKKNNTPIIIGVVVGLVAVGGIIVFMTTGNKPSGPIAKKKVEEPVEPPTAPPIKREPEPTPPPKEETKIPSGKEEPKKEEPKEEPKKEEPAAKPPPATNSKDFKVGALNYMPPNYRPEVAPGKMKELEELIQRKFRPNIVDKFGDYFNALCLKICDDDEVAARFACETLLEICHKKLNMQEGDGTPLKGPWDKWNEPQYRAGFVVTVLQWAKDNKSYFEAIAQGKDPNNLAPEDKVDLSMMPWDKWMSSLSHYSMMAEGKLGYPKDSPEYTVYEKVEKLGKAAYPYLIKYVDNEDPNWAKGAVVALRNLTGITAPLPKNPEEGKASRAKYIKELGLKEEDIPK